MKLQPIYCILIYCNYEMVLIDQINMKYSIVIHITRITDRIYFQYLISRYILNDNLWFKNGAVLTHIFSMLFNNNSYISTLDIIFYNISKFSNVKIIFK